MTEAKQYRHVSRKERRLRRRLRGAAVLVCVPLVFVMAALSIELVEYHPIVSEESVALVEAEVVVEDAGASDRAKDLRMLDATMFEIQEQRDYSTFFDSPSDVEQLGESSNPAEGLNEAASTAAANLANWN